MIDEGVNDICRTMHIKAGSTLQDIIRNGIVSLMIAAEQEEEALDDVERLTKVPYTKIDLKKVVNIDPGDFENPAEIAHALQTATQKEAEKLMITSDFISDIKANLEDVSAEKRQEIGNDTCVARKIAGTTIQKAISTYAFNSDHHKILSISYTVATMPDSYLDVDVKPFEEKISDYLDSDLG